MTTQAPQGQTVTAEQIAERIREKSGVTPETRLMKVAWYPTPADGAAPVGDPAHFKPTILEFGKKCPVSTNRTVFEMFENDAEIRAYCVGIGVPFAVVRLSKSAPIFTIRELTLEAFIDEMADEWSELAESMSTAEKERTAILEYGLELPAEYTLGEFLQDIRDEVHLEEVEDDDEPDEPEVPSAPPTTPDSPQAVAAATAAQTE